MGMVLKDSISPSVQRRGVLDSKTLKSIGADKVMTATTFDNLMIFETPITLGRLRQLGCADRSNFVTVKRINPEHLAMI